MSQNASQRSSLLHQRVDELDLRVEDSPVHAQVLQLYAELDARGIIFHPPCFVANEWGCPDGQPIIGLPFYLIDPRLHEIEEAYADDIEDAERILIGLRHEAGHALNYAYHLYEDPEWQEMFGSFHREYREDYQPSPFSPRFVSHLPGWYAQKHPDEDFAETFAVWLDPRSDWKTRYQGTEAGAKLAYMDRLMARLPTLPVRVPADLSKVDPHELDGTVEELYARRAAEDTPPVAEIGMSLDAHLRQIFTAPGLGHDAAVMIWERRKTLMETVSACTGARLFVVKAVLDTLTSRLRELGLRAQPNREADALIRLTALCTTLVASFLRTGHFVD